MKKVLNFKKMHIFFVGIGGISMSGLAKLVRSYGAKVSGSDLVDGDYSVLKRMGINVYIGHSSLNISSDIDLVVFSGAISSDNVEILECKKRNIPMLERCDFLGIIAQEYDKVIAISGSHGKTSVTAMLGHIFECAKLKPTIHLGGESLNLNNNTIIGDKKYFIVEGCEYRGSFLKLSPTYSMILNIDKDHLDYYQSFSNLKKAFQLFAKNSGYVVSSQLSLVHSNIEIVDKCYAVDKVKITEKGYKFRVFYKGVLFGKFTLNVIGRHNIYNSLFAINIAHKCGISKKVIKNALKSYLGVKRRYEYMGKMGGIHAYADYAHHPTEIKYSLRGIKERWANVLIVFQPHTYSRTQLLLQDFVQVFNNEDVIIYPTYPAREKYNCKGSAYLLYQKIKSANKYYAKNLSRLNDLLQKCLIKKDYSAIIILGAGDLYDKVKEILYTF